MPAPSTTSIGSGFEYEDGELVSIGVPEGRLLHSAAVAADPSQPVARRWQWEYQLKDHLGNLRLAIRMAQPGDGDILIDSFEPGGSARSASSSASSPTAPPMENVAAVRRRLPQRARTGEHVLLLSTPRGTAARQIGPTLRRNVTAGDSVQAEIWASFDLPQRPGWPVRPALGGGAVVPEGVAGKPRTGLLPRLQLSLAGLLALAHRSATDPLPDAYLKLEVYSADSVKQAEAWAYVSDTVPPGQWQRLMAKLSVAQDGYLEAKLVDESPTPVYFDDLLLKISKERGIQENHYDPWGLNLVGIESQPVDRLERKQYNGKEKVSDFGLNWNDHGARFADPQIGGRWMSVDPLASKYLSYSPFVFVLNNPVRFLDPNGKEVVDSKGVKVTYDDKGRGVYEGKDKGVAQYVTAMNMTNTGRQALGALIDNKKETTIKVVADRGFPLGKKNGEHEGYTHTSGITGNSTTYIYLGTLKQEQIMKGKDGHQDQYRDVTNVLEYLNGVGVHEAMHSLNDSSFSQRVTEGVDDDISMSDEQIKSLKEFLPRTVEKETRKEWGAR